MNLYPEHDKLRKVANKSQVIGEFLDWADDAYNLFLAKYPLHGACAERSHRSTDSLLAGFFGIDREALEAEKRHMLSVLRGEE